MNNLLRWKPYLIRVLLQGLGSGASAGWRSGGEGWDCPVKLSLTGIDFLDVKLIFYMHKSCVQSMFEERRHLDGNLLNGIVGTISHDGWKFDSSSWKINKVKPRSLSTLSSLWCKQGARIFQLEKGEERKMYLFVTVYVFMEWSRGSRRVTNLAP